MTGTSQEIAHQYLSGLLQYLAGGGEAALQSAYEVGRKAIADGVGGLEMLAIHQKSLAVALRNTRTAKESAQLGERAANFFAESLSPFEMALRGFREANDQLSRNLADVRTAHQALETERRRYRDLFDFAPDGYLVTDLEGRIEEANRAAGVLIGIPAASLTGTRLLQFVVEESRELFATRLKQLPQDDANRVQDWEFDILVRTGDRFPATLGVRVVRNASGLAVGLRWLLRDVTERKRMEEERAQLLVREQVARAQSEAARRFAFLAEIGNLLVASLDSETTLGDVARRIVPYFADWCLVYLVEPDDRIRLLCTVHQDSAKTDAASLLSRGPVNPVSTIARVLSLGHAETFSALPETANEAVAGEPFDFLREQGIQSLILAPIRTHQRVLGLLVLGAVEPDQYQHDHMALAEDIARRCALAVDNAQLYHAMTVERDKAAEANRAKDEFLGILGHELRNPLVPILGWARNFRKSSALAGDPALSQGVEALERNARNILRLADDCLDLVRISERKVNLEKEPLDLNQTVRGSIETLRPLAEEKGLQLVTRLCPSGLWVLGDRTRLEQVINNLLINAIKYTEPGGQISIRSSTISDEHEIEIQDTGIGIAPEFLGQIFQPFRRGSKEWLTSDAGLGLGLAIARKIVELHGGTIWAESPGLGRGSTFHLRLGAAPSSIPAPDSGSVARREPVQAISLRVLLIDDHKDITDLMKMELEALGYTVLTAADGQVGLDTAIREVPDIIVSDVKMPRMDGFQLIENLRRTPGLASVPVIALTGFGMKRDVEAVLTAGYSAHLNKPADISELSDLIQKLAAQCG